MASEGRSDNREQNPAQDADQAESDAGEDGAAYEKTTPLRDRLPLDSTGDTPKGRFDADGRARDNFGRVIPSRLNWLTLIRAVPPLVAGKNPAFNKEVPASFYSTDVEEDGTPVAVIACPCGEEPRVPISRCAECVCGRFYLAFGGRVLVANSPQTAEGPTPVVD